MHTFKIKFTITIEYVTLITVPSVAPQIETLYSSSSDTIEVSWLPPLFPNGRITGYNLNLYTAGEAQRHFSVAERQNFQFYGTKEATMYR